MKIEEQKPNNQFAFPLALSGEHSYAADGMTLRDYFAAKAMQGLQANIGTNRWNAEKYSVESYKFADAMLKQREL